jgi:uncharacterized protein YggE
LAVGVTGTGAAGTGPEIVTEGTGWHEVLADQAEVELSYSTTARTRADAVRELGRRVAGAEQALAHPAVQVRHRRLWVHNEWRGRRVVGCRASQQIAVLVTDVTAMEEVLAGLVATEPAGLNGPRWTLVDEAAAHREAQRRAVADARGRAEGYAAALGGRLGALHALTEPPEHTVTYRTMAAEAHQARDLAADVQDLGLEPEPVRVTARCTTRWELATDSNQPG